MAAAPPGRRLGLAYSALLVPVFVVAVAGLVQLAIGSFVVGIVLLTVAVLAGLIMRSFFAAIMAYARAMVYRYALGLPVPGISPYLFSGAFVPTRRRRRRRK